MTHKIAVIGMGYVGCGNGLMLAKNFSVSIMDIDHKKVQNFNDRKLPIDDQFAQRYFENENLNISATTNLSQSVKDASFALICLPTNFNDQAHEYDTESIEKVVSSIFAENNELTVVIKSTVNIGYTASLKKKFSTKKILFIPEFLREGHALEDNLYPSRIIIGGERSEAKLFTNILLKEMTAENIPILYMSSTEAESVKLFSNTFLAMRVAYFNELDSFCSDNKIDTKKVIEGVSLDNRVGNFYNNPSFGFGGYCLPKDSKQLLYRFGKTHHNLIEAIQDSNISRINFIVDQIISLSPKIVGIYKLAMKEGSKNSRGSSVLEIIDRLLHNKIEIIVYDPSVSIQDLEGITMFGLFEDFVETSDIIITNRVDDKIRKFPDKLFTRDIFSSDE
jgi:UDPglucose 6-dehydrogenase